MKLEAIALNQNESHTQISGIGMLAGRPVLFTCVSHEPSAICKEATYHFAPEGTMFYEFDTLTTGRGQWYIVRDNNIEEYHDAPGAVELA